MKQESYASISRRQSEQGAALVTCILVLMLITVLGMALTFIGTTSLTVTTNDRQSTQAFYIAQAGASNATAIMIATPQSSWGTVLTSGDGTPNTGDELTTKPAVYLGASFTAITAASLGGVSFNGGTYKVNVGGTSSAPVITSVGTAADGSTATVEVTLNTTPFLGIYSGGTTINTNNPIIRGTAGSLFSVGAISTSNNICADGYVASQSTIDHTDKIKTGSGCGTAGDARQNQQPISFTPLNVATLGNLATYRFGSDGVIYWGGGSGNSGAMTSAQKTAATLNNWSFDSGHKEWDWSAPGPMNNGTIYAQGSNIKISNGSGGGTPSLTLIADGYIDISSGPAITPALAGYSVVSDNDIKLTNNVNTSGSPGIVYASNQIEITGSPNLYGSLVAANINDNTAPGGTNLVDRSTKGTLNISAAPTITYNGGGPLGKAIMSAWREVRN